eukprot:evm.model.scf_1391EXC.1 EVM.evm.TU.scf_1391EXC.1   scf_1391EXC:25071-31792(+)
MPEGTAAERLESDGVRKFLESLPEAVRVQVEKLRTLQHKCDGLKSDYVKERRALEDKYRKLYEPVYKERSAIIVGEKGLQSNGQDSDAGPGAVPGFWLKVLKSAAIVAEHITVADEAVLKYLIDIKVDALQGDKRGFKLSFHFAPNDFFKHKVLEKTYLMGDEEDALLENTEGMEIKWEAGKNPGLKVLKKKSKNQNAPPRTKTIEVHSFFDFFAPPKLPESGEDDDMDVGEIAELHEIVEDDFEVGCLIKEMLVPHAVSWFTGEMMDEQDSDDEDDDDEDEDDLDEDDEEDFASDEDEGDEV